MSDSTLRKPGWVAGEILVVVLGILIAFALDAWWDARATREWETTQLELLKGEFQTNLEHLEGVIRVHERSARNVQQVIDFLERTPDGVVGELPDSVVTGLIAWRTAEVSTGTLDALLASGDLSEIHDAELRSRLAAWPVWARDAEQDEHLARDFVEFVLTPALAGQGLLPHAHAARPSRRTPAHPEDGAPVLSSQTLRDLAAVRLTHLELARASQRDVQAEIREILAALEADLATR